MNDDAVSARSRVIDDDDDLLFCCMLQLDARSLATCAAVNRRWRVLSRASRTWVPHCVAQWKGKQVPWASMAGKASWYERYVLGESLLRSTGITAEELQDRLWLFSDGQNCKFLTIPGIGPRLIMDSYPPLRWSFNADGTLQIEHFPRHFIDRLPNWGFRIWNEHVHMLSLPDEPNLPVQLLQELADPESLPRPSSASLRALCTT